MITHAWMWAVVMLVLTIHMLILTLHYRSFRSTCRLPSTKVLAASVAGAIIALAVASTFAAFGSAVESMLSSAILGNIRSMGWFVSDLQTTLVRYSDEMYSNWLLLTLASIGVLSMAREQTQTRTLLGSWVLGPSAMALFFGTAIQWRLLFVIPYGVFAALGLSACLNVLGTRISETSRMERVLVEIARWGLFVCVVLLFLDNVIRSSVFLAIMK